MLAITRIYKNIFQLIKKYYAKGVFILNVIVNKP